MMFEPLRYVAKLKEAALNSPDNLFSYVNFNDPTIVNYAIQLKNFYQLYQEYLLTFKQFIPETNFKKLNLDYDILRFISAFETVFIKGEEFNQFKQEKLSKEPTLVISIGSNNNSELIFANNPFDYIMVDKAEIGFLVKHQDLPNVGKIIPLLETELTPGNTQLPESLQKVIKDSLNQQPNKVNVLIIANEFIHLNPNYINIIANIVRYVYQNLKSKVSQIEVLVVENNKDSIHEWDETLERIPLLYNGLLFDTERLFLEMKVLQKRLPNVNMQIEVFKGATGKIHQILNKFTPGYIFGYAKLEVKDGKGV